MKRSIVLVTLLLGCIALTSATKVETVAPQSFKGPVGLQLYSLREQFKKDVPAPWTRCVLLASLMLS